MIITTWNIRGLNSKGKQRYLRDRLKTDKPNIMIIQETKISTQKMEEIMRGLIPHCELMGQDAVGSAGGLAILWNPEEVQFGNWVNMPRILSGAVRMIGSLERIILTGVYGPHLTRKRRSFLQNMRKI